ncbi:MAG: hypothetical protein RQ966_02270 [Acetobacteraceae bacterium]|nr:hypothetical protein [Acetobacteraceae bacterium]
MTPAPADRVRPAPEPIGTGEDGADLLALLDARAAAGDAVCARAARALRAPAANAITDGAITGGAITGGAMAGDAMAAAVDRLLSLVQAQEEQIRALRALIETGL